MKLSTAIRLGILHNTESSKAYFYIDRANHRIQTNALGAAVSMCQDFELWRIIRILILRKAKNIIHPYISSILRKNFPYLYTAESTLTQCHLCREVAFNSLFPYICHLIYNHECNRLDIVKIVEDYEQKHNIYT